MSSSEILNNKITTSVLGETLHGCDDGELFFEETTSENFTYDDNALKDASFNKSKGYGLRAVKDDISGYSHSNVVNLESIKDLVNIYSK